MVSPKKSTRPRPRRPLLLRRAMLHSALCFLLLGFLAGLAPAARWTASASAHVSRALHAIDGAFDHTMLLLQQQQRQLRDGCVHVVVLPSPALEPLRQPQLLLVVTAPERSDSRHARAQARAPAGAVAGGGARGGGPAHGAAAARRRGGVPAPDLPGELHGRRRRHGEGAAPPAEPGAGARGGAPARRCGALRRPWRRLRSPLFRSAQADQGLAWTTRINIVA